MDRPLSSLPKIETKRLHLRPLGQLDAASFRDMTDELSIIEAVDFLKQPFTLLDAEKLLIGNNDGCDCFWGVTRQDIYGLIGTVGTHLSGSDEVEIGYWFASAVRGKGFASEAVAGIAATLTTAYPNRLIYAECKQQNTASWRLLERAGFHADGTKGEREGRSRLVFVRQPKDAC